MDRSYCPVQGQSDRNMEKPGLDRIIYREIYCSRYVGIQARGCSVCARKHCSLKVKKRVGKTGKWIFWSFFRAGNVRVCSTVIHLRTGVKKSSKPRAGQ